MINSQQLTNCDKEPIHIAGAIQPVGFLMLLDPATLETLMMVGDAPANFKDNLLAASCPSVSDYLTDQNQQQALYTRVSTETTPYGVRIHKIDNRILVEAIAHRDAWDSVYNLLQSLHQLFDRPASSDELHHGLCAFVKQLTDYERVMLYRFERDDHGVVTGEAKVDEIDSYLHHHFPASDIPVQARSLYVKNRVRFIANVEHQTLPLDPEFSKLDMSDCILRAVSPIHIQYLKNMDVTASMSISIVIDGKLWGLIACHDRRERHISVENLKLLQLLSLVCSREINRYEKHDYLQQKQTLDRALNNIYNSALLFMERDKTQNVIQPMLKKLNQLYECDYAILKIGKEVYASDDIALSIFKELTPFVELTDLFICEQFDQNSTLYEKYRGKIAGAIGMRFDAYRDSQLWLCRKEVSQTIVWAGNPAKDSTTGLISPRKSFEDWEEILANKPVPWREAEIFTVSHQLKKYLSKLFNYSEDSLRGSLLESSEVSLIVTDPNQPGNPIIHVNEAFTELYGYQANEVVGHNPRILHGGLIDEKTQSRFRQALANKESLSILVKNIGKNGNFLWIMNNINPVYDDRGELIYYIGTQFNITAIKDESSDTVSEHELIEKSLNTQDNLLVICDGKSLKYVNKKFLQFFGYQSLQEFTSNHENINEMFVSHELFIGNSKLEPTQNWVEEMLRLTESQRVVGMLSESGKIHSFNVNISHLDNNYLISFTDTTADMTHQIDLMKAATQDPLTGAFNRQYFKNNIDRLVDESSRSEKQLGIIMADIDHFKQVNDTFGHAAGDELLQAFVDMLMHSLRKDDWIVRWGGEEFVIVTLVQEDEDIKIIAENLRKRIENVYTESVGRVTASFGATTKQLDETTDETLARADEAMYRAKKAGRNRVEFI